MPVSFAICDIVTARSPFLATSAAVVSSVASRPHPSMARGFEILSD
jgi:hypothetical protein